MRKLLAFIILAASIPAAAAGASIDGDAMDLGELLGKADVCKIEVSAEKLVRFSTKKGLLDTRPMGLTEQSRRVAKLRFTPSEANCAVTRASLKHNDLI